MPDLPFPVPQSAASALLASVDREGKIDRALEALGPIVGRDVVAIDPGERQAARWAALGARLTTVGSIRDEAADKLADESADAVIAVWSGFRGIDPTELAAADRILRPGGRLLVVHDYGRDDVSRLRGDLPEYGAWSRRDGPFLANGFRVRVIHCFWTFDDVDAARATLTELFGAARAEPVAGVLRRPRLSWNVAVYHRTRSSGLAAEATVGAARPIRPAAGAARAVKFA